MIMNNQFNRILHLRMPGLILATAALLLVACGGEPEKTEAAPSEEIVSPQRLVGQWTRTDGNYMLNIRRVRSSGKLEATYHNPRPINVETAELRQDGQRIGVFIELRDRGYPGSYYELLYSEGEDMLIGDYFQATQQAVYEVAFVRK
jgi:hypothetical protein